MGCIHPLTISPYKNYTKYIQVPCGKCSWCLKQRTKDLSLRLDAEASAPDTVLSFFVTLTYDDNHLSYVTDPDGTIYFRLNRRDVQLYHKRLRKSLSVNFPDLKFKFLLCGEYGDKFKRPHYHCIYFIKNKSIDRDVFRFLIEKSWCNGFVNVQKVRSFGCYYYMTKYCQKSLAADIIDCLKAYKPFIISSHNLGLHLLNSLKLTPDNLTVSNSFGQSHTLPRFYKDKLVSLGKWDINDRFQSSLNAKSRYRLYEKLQIRKCNFDLMLFAREHDRLDFLQTRNEFLNRFNSIIDYGYKPRI